jgi:hypothetical protein
MATARQQQVLAKHTQNSPVTEVHDAVVGAVAGDDAAHRLKPRVHGELVQRAEVVRFLLAAERGEVFPGAIEAVNVVAGVAVGHVEVAVGRHVETRQREGELPAPRIPVLELVGNRRRGNRHHDLAVERHLHDGLLA